MEEVLETPARIANKEKKNVVVVFDEFQQILQYENDLVERKLRSVIQNHRKVAYIFFGQSSPLDPKNVHGKKPTTLSGGRPLPARANI
jgi:uncharacterized protein